MSMLSNLVDALDAPEGPSVPRAGVFQPKVKARVRKGGGRGDGAASAAAKVLPAAPAAAKPPPALPAGSNATTEVLDLNKSTTEEIDTWQPSKKASDALLSGENNDAQELTHVIPDSTRDAGATSPVTESVPLEVEVAKVTYPRRTLPVEPAKDSSPADNVPVHVEDTANATIKTIYPPVAVRSNFPVPSSVPRTEENEDFQEDILLGSEEPSSSAPAQPFSVQEGFSNGVAEPTKVTKLKNFARKVRKDSTSVADVPVTSSKGAVDDDVEEALITLEDNTIAKYAVQEEHTASEGRKRKRAFPHSTSQPKRRQRLDGAGSSKGAESNKPNYDLSNPGSLPLREVIRRAENIERKKAKEELAKKSLLEIQNPKERDVVREPEPPRDVLSLAPQVQVLNGRIVVNEQSLTIGAYATSAQDTEKYTRVEENASRLNYHTYSNRTITERWKPEETDLFYRAIRQLGTDFDLIQNLFPTRTRRQIKAKYKKEETVNPRRLSDALTYRPNDQSHYKEMLTRMKCDDLIQDNSDPFASILAYSASKERAEVEEKAEVENNGTEEDIPASIVQ